MLNKICKNEGTLKSCKPIWALASVSVFAILLSAGGYGYHKGVEATKAQPLKENVALRKAIKRKKSELSKFKQTNQAHLNALALKLGKLQAHMLRVEALGSRLTGVGKLDSKEFDFSSPPPLGGPIDVFANSVSKAELSSSVKTFSRVLFDREAKLETLEQVLLRKNLSESIYPSGYPVRKGWVSSSYGRRKDPFNGKKSYHKGIDIAGKSGSDLLVVGAGVVIFSGVHGGHGRMVEVDHGNGLITRYAHNLLNLVDVGDTVKKGEVVALMGQSGRATGPHVHFEVLRNNKHVNPERYLRSQK